MESHVRFAIAIWTSGDCQPACDWLALMDPVDLSDPLTVECSDIGSQLTVIWVYLIVLGPPGSPYLVGARASVLDLRKNNEP